MRARESTHRIEVADGHCLPKAGSRSSWGFFRQYRIATAERANGTGKNGIGRNEAGPSPAAAEGDLNKEGEQGSDRLTRGLRTNTIGDTIGPKGVVTILFTLLLILWAGHRLYRTYQEYQGTTQTQLQDQSSAPQLDVLFRHTREYGGAMIVEGEIKNISPEKLDAVEAVITFYSQGVLL